jgi:hypothetical protein
LQIALAILMLVAGQQAPLAPRAFVPATVRLLDAGAAPRAPLRYALKRPQEVTVVVRGEWSTDGNQRAFPTFTTPLRLLPGDSRVQFQWLKPSALAPGSRPSTLDAASRDILLGLEGSEGLYACDARGIISNFLLRPGPNDPLADAGTAMQQRSFYALQMGRGMLQLLAVPLPDEPVGVGARWQVERSALRGPLSFIQFTTFTLERRVGSMLELSYRFGGLNDPTTGIRDSEMKLEVSGGGKATVDLTSPLPISLEDEITLSARSNRSVPQAGFVGTHLESK